MEIGTSQLRRCEDFSPKRFDWGEIGAISPNRTVFAPAKQDLRRSGFQVEPDLTATGLAVPGQFKVRLHVRSSDRAAISAWLRAAKRARCRTLCDCRTKGVPPPAGRSGNALVPAGRDFLFWATLSRPSP